MSLDEGFDTDFIPFVWIPAVSNEAAIVTELAFQHFWDDQLHRWRRTPVTCVAHEFQKLTRRVWHNRAGKTGEGSIPLPWLCKSTGAFGGMPSEKEFSKCKTETEKTAFWQIASHEGHGKAALWLAKIRAFVFFVGCAVHIVLLLLPCPVSRLLRALEAYGVQFFLASRRRAFGASFVVLLACCFTSFVL